METADAQNLILKAVENPDAQIPSEQLALAIATVIVRKELLGASFQTITTTVLTQEG